jgi:hypothetical protein
MNLDPQDSTPENLLALALEDLEDLSFSLKATETKEEEFTKLKQAQDRIEQAVRALEERGSLPPARRS